MSIPQIPLSTILFTISAIAILYCLCSKNNNFIDIRMVFRQHFLIFKDAPLQKIVFITVPLLLAVAIVDLQSINKDIINNLNIVISILLSMLFAMLSILASFQFKSSVQGQRYNTLLKETFNTIIFEIILCIILLLLSFIVLFINDYTASFKLTALSFIIYYLFLTVAINILIVVKRVKILFDNR